MAELINSIEFVIDTNTTNSGNATRDSTLKKTVFGYLKTPNTISGSLSNASQLDVFHFSVFVFKGGCSTSFQFTACSLVPQK